MVRIVKGDTVTVTPTGSLVANGSAGAPGHLRGEGRRPGLGVDPQPRRHSVAQSRGGRPAAAIRSTPTRLRRRAAHAEPEPRSASFHVDDVEIAGSLSQGVYINGPVGFDATSQNLRVHGSAGYPVHVYARVIGSVPSGTYTGNGADAIAIAGTGGPVARRADDAQRAACRITSAAAPDGGRMDINSQAAGQVAVLTIEPGVTLQFPPGGTLNVEPGSGTAAAQGALIAIGGATEAEKIVFTSDRGLPRGRRLARHRLRRRRRSAQHDAEHAGRVRRRRVGLGQQLVSVSAGVAINDAAIRIFGPPPTQFITNSEIRSSARYGIDRGWRADLQPDFLASNTFTAVSSCKETTPRTFSGVCPAVVPCP